MAHSFGHRLQTAQESHLSLHRMTDLLQQLQASLGASYEVQRELTAGGMSRVFLAEDKALGRRVVIKVLSPMLSAELSHERFRREIRVAASLQHPHIVPLLTAGEANGLPYFTMPFVEGMVSSTILTLVVIPVVYAFWRERALPVPTAAITPTTAVLLPATA